MQLRARLAQEGPPCQHSGGGGERDCCDLWSQSQPETQRESAISPDCTMWPCLSKQNQMADKYGPSVLTASLCCYHIHLQTPFQKHQQTITKAKPTNNNPTKPTRKYKGGRVCVVSSSAHLWTAGCNRQQTLKGLVFAYQTQKKELVMQFYGGVHRRVAKRSLLFADIALLV